MYPTILTPPIGILGGTFDPIHFGHLRLAWECYQYLRLAQIRFIPCQQPVHKPAAQATATQRAAMLQMAIAQQSAFVIDDRELRRTSASYSVDTLLSLRQELPNTPLCLIIGADALLGITRWYRWQELLELAHLVVAHRPGHELPLLQQIHPRLALAATTDSKALHYQLAGKIFIQAITALDISSTDIRRQIALGYLPHYLLPTSVWELIHEQGLYVA